MTVYRSLALVTLLASLPAIGKDANLASGTDQKSSSERAGNGPALVADGDARDSSRWLAAENDPSPWVEIALVEPARLAAIDVYSGYEDKHFLADFDLSFEQKGQWVKPAGGIVRGNEDIIRRVLVSVENVTRVRLSLIAPGAGRIREIALYSSASRPIGTDMKGSLPSPRIPRDIHQIALNQIGFEKNRLKRFTAPLSADGTSFIVRTSSGGAPLFKGSIRGNIGDFTGFRPDSSEQEYVIEVRGGDLKNGIGDPFEIRDNLWQDSFWQPAVDFLIDTRSVLGTHPSAYGGCPWRDGTYYDFMLPSLALFYLADPATVEAMPRQIDWAADKARIMDPDFPFFAKTPNSEGVLKTTRRYFTELEPPSPKAPDVVKLLHWGAGYYLMNPVTSDPSGDPDGRKIHSQTVEQIAYIVWAWPKLQKWLPASFYEKCRDFCFANWGPSLEINKWWQPKTYLPIEKISGNNPMGGLLHPYKGRHAPGHSIVPNLLMHEIAKREKRSDAAKYLNAAVTQAGWIVDNLDWNDPRTTKGHRMSEHRTIPNLVWFLQKYPGQAPNGLQNKIEEWAKVAVDRSDNLWDFRRYDDDKHWTIPKLNDIGNSASFPAIALSAAWAVRDPALKKRLEELSVSHIDFMFGRNPRLAAAPDLPKTSFPGIERGWPKHHPHDRCARLETVRGSIASGPGSEMFPFNPDATYRHAEGWVNYGASWCVSLAYLKFHANQTTPAP